MNHPRVSSRMIHEYATLYVVYNIAASAGAAGAALLAAGPRAPPRADARLLPGEIRALAPVFRRGKAQPPAGEDALSRGLLVALFLLSSAGHRTGHEGLWRRRGLLLSRHLRRRHLWRRHFRRRHLWRRHFRRRHL